MTTHWYDARGPEHYGQGGVDMCSVCEEEGFPCKCVVCGKSERGHADGDTHTECEYSDSDGLCDGEPCVWREEPEKCCYCGDSDNRIDERDFY